MTVNEYGKGRVYYVGCDLDNDAMKELVRIIAKSANVETVDTPNGVEVVCRDDCTIILNHNENEVDTKIKGVSLFDGLKFDGVLTATEYNFGGQYMIYKFKEFKDEPLLINHLNMGGKNPKGEEINVTSRYFTRNGKPG